MPNLPPNPTKPDFKSLATLVRSSSPTTATIEDKRRTVAELCKLLGRRMLGPAASAEAAVVPTPTPPRRPPEFVAELPPRRREVLDLLLRGKSEKEVGGAMKISIHTVHVHVKAIYKLAEVSSRAELLAKCLTDRGPTGP